MQTLPQGRKSRVEILPDGATVRKTYNGNGDPAERFCREVGFYTQYRDSRVVPQLVDYEPGRYITIERVTGQRLVEMAPLPHGVTESLADHYVDTLVELFGNSTGVDTEVKQRYYEGQGANDNIRLLIQDLDSLGRRYHGHEVIDDLRRSVAQVKADAELLIKLDWNAENLFVRDGRVHKLIDFEQAFIGTRNILVGILLHNPFWPAQRLFCGLRQAGLFLGDVCEFRRYLCFAFAAVLADSVRRRGDIWSVGQLETTFERHVKARHREIADAL